MVLRISRMPCRSTDISIAVCGFDQMPAWRALSQGAPGGIGMEKHSRCRDVFLLLACGRQGNFEMPPASSEDVSLLMIHTSESVRQPGKFCDSCFSHCSPRDYELFITYHGPGNRHGRPRWLSTQMTCACRGIQGRLVIWQLDDPKGVGRIACSRNKRRPNSEQ
jgi:hypothetical protein